MNPLYPLFMIFFGFGGCFYLFYLWDKKGVDPENKWTGGLGKLLLIIGLGGAITILPATIIWYDHHENSISRD